MQQAVRWTLLHILLGVAVAHAQEPQAVPEDPVHDELRALRDGLLDAYQEKDIEGRNGLPLGDLNQPAALRQAQAGRTIRNPDRHDGPVPV